MSKRRGSDTVFFCRRIRTVAFSPSPNNQSPNAILPFSSAGGAVFYNDQDYQWNEDGGAALPGAPRGQFSKQAARGKFFSMLSKKRRGGARAGNGVEVIGCVDSGWGRGAMFYFLGAIARYESLGAISRLG